MATLKRSREAMESSDDDEEPSMGRQTLPVARLPETFCGEPVDGMQYLFLVRRDSRKLPSYTRAANPFKSVPQSTKTEAENSSALSRARAELPSEEWRSVFMKRFRNFRKNSVQPTIGVSIPFASSAGSSRLLPERKERDRWWDFINGRSEFEWNPPKKPKKPKKPKNERRDSGWQRIHGVNDDLVQYEVPITQDVADDAFVPEALVVNEYGEVTEDQLGQDSADLETPVLGVEEGAGSLPTPFGTPQPEERYKVSDHESERRKGGPRQPTPTLLKLMDSRYCMHLLMYFTHWITQHLEHLESDTVSSSPFSHLSQNHARWMFALLSRVDEQLTSDELSTLRGLARACIAFIKDLNKNTAIASEGAGASEEKGNERGQRGSGVRWVGDPADAPLDEKACWMVVAIISEFWGQKDMWMDAENALLGP